ncbi:ABC transporter [Streptomyces sp. IMTB 2501]|uniref:ATP-binding cassette domain-containing protein n=1 Tax=Streptomyces sp. IMTB 2501 TaxID=1776340 RepID=UPI00096C53D0|nr:ABC transporter [Streptomyces sp. IMTB 2501]
MIQAFGLTSNSRKANRPAVDDVSFEAHAGHVTVLLGGAGAGKTTALRLMLELQQGRGITYFRGRPLHRIAHPSREVGVLLGDVPGHPARSVRGHLRMLCAASGVSARRADEVLEAVGLVGLREERLGSLSRGMDRRLGLACALLPDPHTLVLDEPADGLSPREMQWLHGMLRAHADQGGTVLCTTADAKEAARAADRVVTLDRGRLVADQEGREFARTRLRPRVAVRSPHAARLAALLTKEARTARRSVEVVREGGNRLSVYGSTTADVGETAFRHGILVHQLADETGDMGPGAGTAPQGISPRNTSAEPQHEPPTEHDHPAPDSSPTESEPTVRDLLAAEPEATVHGLPVGEPEVAVPGLSAAEPEAVAHGLPAVDSGTTLHDLLTARPEAMIRGHSVAQPRAALRRLSAMESERTAGGLPSAGPGTAARGVPQTEPGTAVRGLPQALSGAAGLAAAAQPAVGASALGSTAADADASASDSPPSEQASAASGRPSGAAGGTASTPSAGERRAMPFGFSAEDRKSAEGDTPTAQRAASSVASDEEPLTEESPAGERPQAVGGEKPSLGKAPNPRPETEHTDTTPRAPSEGASRAEAAPAADHTAHGGVDPDREGAPGESTEAVPAEVFAGAAGAAGADGARTAEATPPADAEHDAVRPAKEPQAGSANTPTAGISALRARLPGARNPRTRQPQTAGAARPDGVRSLDALSPLPPPISVRPAPSPLRPLRYEIRRATGIGVGFLTCGVVLVLSALTAVLLARLGHTPQERLFAAWPQELPLPPAALAAGLLGALAFGDEFRHPALAVDRGTVPRRLGLLTAKLLVSGATAVLLAFATMGCDAEVLYVVYGRDLTQVPADWLSMSVSWFGLVVGCAWAGVLAAGVFRSTAGGLAAVLAVPVVVVPLVHEAMRGPVLRMAAGFPVRMREVLLLQWPFGGERYLLGMARVLAQPVGGALVLSISALLCAYLVATLRTRFR